MVRSGLCSEWRKRRGRDPACWDLRRKELRCSRDPKKHQGAGVWRVLRAEVKSKGLCKPFKALKFSLKAKRSSILKTFKAKRVCVCARVSERGLILERLPDNCVKKEECDGRCGVVGVAILWVGLVQKKLRQE